MIINQKIYVLNLIIIFSLLFSAPIVKNDSNRSLYIATNIEQRCTENTGNCVRNFIISIKKRLGYVDAANFPLIYYKIGKESTKHFLFQQIYENIPVWGRYIRVHMKNDFIISFSSNIKKINLNTLPLFTRDDALDIVYSKHVEKNTYLKYHNIQIYIRLSVPYLVHIIDVINLNDPWKYMIDAQSGKIIDKIPLLYEDGPTIGSGINLLNETVDTLYIYEGESFAPIGQDLTTPNLICDDYCFDYGDCGDDYDSHCIPSPEQGSCPDGYILDCNGSCFNDWYMQFPGVGNGFCNDPWIDYSEDDINIGIYNLVDESSSYLGNIYTINSYGGFYTNLSYVNSETQEFINTYTPNSHKSGVSAHDYQRKTLDYYWSTHGYAGIDGNGKRTVSVVNYTNTSGGLDQRNAFYNAALDVLTYGLGGNGYRPFCAAQDIVTHEFTHGFTAHTSGLIYRNQAGAMNESISDVFGYLVEAEFQDGGDWTQGEDVHYSGASRSFIHPPDYNQPDHIDHPYFVPYNDDPQWSNDFGGVHYNSGIPNKIMYLVINGDNHYGIEVQPFNENISLSRDIAAKIWFAWNSYYLDPEDDFLIGRAKMLQVCADLYPDNLDYYQTIASAWASTGIGDEFVILVGDINEDLLINVLDIVELVNLILYDNPEGISLDLADINLDGEINILDVVELVAIILD